MSETKESLRSFVLSMFAKYSPGETPTNEDIDRIFKGISDVFGESEASGALNYFIKVQKDLNVPFNQAVLFGTAFAILGTNYDRMSPEEIIEVINMLYWHPARWR